MGNVQAVQFHPEKSGGKCILHLIVNTSQLGQQNSLQYVNLTRDI
jgi:imidazoleglycerol phosphate synthase glutamine amidotransferase subunit HisH